MHKNKKDSPIQIVIVGGGFAGTYAYRELHRHFKNHLHEIEVTLISERDVFLFTPLIHEVATGNLSPSDVTQPIRQISEGCLARFIEGNVDSIHCDGKKVFMHRMYANTDEIENLEIPYDYLILAAGSEVNFFNTPGAKEFSFPLKTLDDTRALKNKVVDAFVTAQQRPAREQERLLRFVVVGGGATGVEVTGELADFTNREMKKAFPHIKSKCRILLAEALQR